MTRPTSTRAPGLNVCDVCDGCKRKTNRLVRVGPGLHVCADCWPEAQALLAAERTQQEPTKQ